MIALVAAAWLCTAGPVIDGAQRMWCPYERPAKLPMIFPRTPLRFDDDKFRSLELVPPRRRYPAFRPKRKHTDGP